MSEIYFMEKAIQLALDNVTTSQGGPFGAIIVRDGKIIAIGRNAVTATNDPTAHAEVQAIRAACQVLQDFRLTDCDIYTSCEPCPMCLGAIYWAGIKSVYFASSTEDAAKIGFADYFIYEQFSLQLAQRKIPMKRIQPANWDWPFRTWQVSKNKIDY